MKRLESWGQCLLLSLGSLGIGSAIGFWAARSTMPERIEREVETVEQVRTVVVRERIEATRQAQATERLIERRVVEACPVCAASASVRLVGEISGGGHASACPAIETPPTAATSPGRVVFEERIVERAIASSERLRLDVGQAEHVAARHEQATERTEGPALPRWRLSALAGYSWGDAAPVYGLAAGVRIVGPLEVGAWGATSAQLRGAAGLSVGLSW